MSAGYRPPPAAGYMGTGEGETGTCTPHEARVEAARKAARTRAMRYGAPALLMWSVGFGNGLWLEIRHMCACRHGVTWCVVISSTGLALGQGQ